MNGRKGHTPKNNPQRRAYREYVNTAAFEPTLDQTLSLPTSDRRDVNEPITESSADAPSSRARSSSIGEHFKEHWVEWLCAAVGILLFYFMVEAKIESVRMGGAIENHQGAIDELKGEVREHESRLYGHDRAIDTLPSYKDSIRGLADGAAASNAKNIQQDLLLNEHSVRLSSLERQNSPTEPVRSVPSTK